MIYALYALLLFFVGIESPPEAEQSKHPGEDRANDEPAEPPPKFAPDINVPPVGLVTSGGPPYPRSFLGPIQRARGFRR